jgi:hypothetical protein
VAAEPSRRSTAADDFDFEEDDRPSRRSARPARDRADREPEFDDDPAPRRSSRRRKSGSNLGLILWLSGAGVAVIGLVIVLIVVLGGGGGVTKENFAKLKAGMTEKQVVAILGSPDTGVDAGKMFGGGNVDIGGRKINLGGVMPKTLMWQSGEDFIQAIFQGDSLTAWQGKFGNEMMSRNGFGGINIPNMRMPNFPKF